MNKACVIAPALSLALTTAVAEQGPTAEDYAAASALLEANVKGLVKNVTVAPKWLGDSSRFWYLRDSESGKQ